MDAKQNGTAGAFSRTANVDSQGCNAQVGLTKREYFAGLAMQGILACPGTLDWSAETTAGQALTHADALLAAMEAKP